MSAKEYEVVIGLECHVQLATTTKLFSSAPSHYGDPPNHNVDVVDVAIPGTLPVVNKAAVTMAIRLGLALGSTVNQRSTFARKHYFYPDLPKGYQISQFDEPIVKGGVLVVDGRPIRITRAHLEEDAGKSMHADGPHTLLDYNRAGTPLLEVVSEPDLRSPDEAMRFFRDLRSLVMALGICDGNLQEGSMRADANVSIRKIGEQKLGQRVELKNINSPRFLAAAVDNEFHRQVRELGVGHPIAMETRLWDADKRESRSMRSKEEAHDYRYMPDPDLPTLVVTDDEIAIVRASMPELPEARRARFEGLGVSAVDAALLSSEPSLGRLFDDAVTAYAKGAKAIANWILNELLAIKGADGIASVMSPQALASLVRLVDDGVISGKIAKDVLGEIVAGRGTDPQQIVDALGWKMVKDTGAVERALDEAIKESPSEWQKLVEGKGKVAGYFVGLVMKKLQGKADPKEVNRLLDEKRARSV